MKVRSMLGRTARLAAALALLAAAQVLATAQGTVAPDQAMTVPDQAAADQSAESSLFDPGAFDSASPNASLPSATAVASETAKTEYLVGGEVLVSASLFAPASLDGYALTASASGKLFGKVSVPDYGSLYLSYGISQALLEGRGGTGAVALAPPLDLTAPSISMDELYYSFDISKLVFIRLGKQLLAWGPSQVWTPVDFVNDRRANFFASVDLRQGEPGLKLLVPFGKADAMLFADFSDMVTKDIATGSLSTAGLDSTRYALRVDATIGGFELGLSGIVASKYQDRLGLDFSGNLYGFATYGELGIAPAYSNYAASCSASLGLSRALGDLRRWTISAEGFYQSSGADYTGDAAAMSTLAPLYMGTYYGYLSLKADELLSQYLATNLYGLANLSDRSYSVTLEEDVSLPRAVPFSLLVSYAGGGRNKEFTFVAGDNSLSLTARTLIRF